MRCSRLASRPSSIFQRKKRHASSGFWLCHQTAMTAAAMSATAFLALGKGRKAQSMFWSLNSTGVVGTAQQIVSVAALPLKKDGFSPPRSGAPGLNRAVRSLVTISKYSVHACSIFGRSVRIVLPSSVVHLAPHMGGMSKLVPKRPVPATGGVPEKLVSFLSASRNCVHVQEFFQSADGKGT